jgi:hypothetical protein
VVCAEPIKFEGGLIGAGKELPQGWCPESDVGNGSVFHASDNLGTEQAMPDPKGTAVEDLAVEKFRGVSLAMDDAGSPQACQKRK